MKVPYHTAGFWVLLSSSHCQPQRCAHMIRGAGDVVGSALLYKGPEEGCCAFYMREAHRRCCEGLPMGTSHVKRIASLSSKP